MKVLVKKTLPNAVLPTCKYVEDFGRDVTAAAISYPIDDNPYVIKYDTGLAFQLVPNDYTPYKDGALLEFKYYETLALAHECNLCIRLDPRSSIYKTGLILSNSSRIIDRNYRGSVSAVFYHVIPQLEPYKLGDRIAQISISIALKMDFEESEELDDTSRGAGGYGSTGR